MAFAWYAPTLVQQFGSVKNADINANLKAIQAAFNAQNALTLVSAAYVVQASGPRNFLVDLSQTGGFASYVALTLPANPTVGDPPVNVAIIAAGTSFITGLTQNVSLVFLTTDGNKIQTYTPAGVIGPPYLTNAGDSISLSFIGGIIGWNVSASSIGTYVNPTGGDMLPFGFVFNGCDYNIDQSAFGATVKNFAIPPVPQSGMKFSFVLRAKGAGSITVGSAGFTFNGVAGPYSITTLDTKYQFTFVGGTAFIVTT